MIIDISNLKPYNTMLIYAKLAAIQAELKAPKSQFNKFGNYHYRKAEDILEAVKPILAKNGCILNCTDELMLIGDRYYIKASAIITAIDDGSQMTTTAFAREEAEKKGMDGSQITGASSSYARKYALNGLFCIDDTADSDTTNQGDGEKKPATKKAEKKVEKKALPERGSDEWNKWVKAALSGWTSKQGKTAREAFKATYAADEDTMDDVLACLDEDVFNARIESGQPANAPATKSETAKAK